MRLFHYYLLAVLAVLLMVLSNLMARFAVVYFQASPPVYAAFAMLTGAITLLIIAGPGKSGLATLRSPHTWLYGVMQTLFGISEVYAYGLTTTSESTILFRFTIVLTILTSWLFLRRAPKKVDVASAIVILLCLGYVALNLPPDLRAMAILVMILGSLFLTLRTLVAETHPESVAANNIRERCCVTGVVLLITSVMFMGGYIFAGTMLDWNAKMGNEVAAFMPSLSHFLNPKALLIATLSGVGLVSVSTYLYFLSAKHINADNWMLVVTSAIPMTFVLEFLLSKTGVFTIQSLSSSDILVGMIVTAVAALMAFSRQRKK